MQGGLVFRQPALGQDIAAALVQFGQRPVQSLLAALLPVGGFHRQRGVGAVVFQVILGSLPTVLVIGAHGRVKGQVATAEASLHALHFLHIDTQLLGHRAGLLGAEPGQVFLGAAQVEKQFALGLGRGHLDDAPVAQDVLVHFGLDPVHRERHQAHPFFRIEALDCLHQADIALLYQVGFGQAVTGIAAGDMHHKTQVGHNQLPRRRQVVVVI